MAVKYEIAVYIHIYDKIFAWKYLFLEKIQD